MGRVVVGFSEDRSGSVIPPDIDDDDDDDTVYTDTRGAVDVVVVGGGGDAALSGVNGAILKFDSFRFTTVLIDILIDRSID
jgi:hypothetical protein